MGCGIKCSVVRILISRSGQLKGGMLTDEGEFGESDAEYSPTFSRSRSECCSYMSRCTASSSLHFAVALMSAEHMLYGKSHQSDPCVLVAEA